MTTPPNTRPFNLQDFLNGKPIVCRNGFVPTDAHYFEKAVAPNNRIVFTNENGHLIFSSCNTGCSTYYQSDNGEYDLFHPCEQKEGWVVKDYILSNEMFENVAHPENFVKITWYE